MEELLEQPFQNELWVRSVLLEPEWANRSPRGLPVESSAVGLRSGPSVCFSNKLPGDADGTSGPSTNLGRQGVR